MSDPLQEALSTLTAKVNEFVPSGFRDEDGVWWDGPHRLEAQRAIDDLRALAQRVEDAERENERLLNEVRLLRGEPRIPGAKR